MLLVAALLVFLTGCAHSYLGERYLLIRLFQRGNLPKLFGGSDFTEGTLRFAWHITTVAWWGIAWLLVLAYRGPLSTAHVLHVIAGTALVSAALPMWFTRGKHLSWVVFILVAALVFFAAWFVEVNMAAQDKVTGPASYFPSIEKKYGKPIAHWMQVLEAAGPLKHMELVDQLKSGHGLGHGHANALVAWHLARK